MGITSMPLQEIWIILADLIKPHLKTTALELPEEGRGKLVISGAVLQMVANMFLPMELVTPEMEQNYPFRSDSSVSRRLASRTLSLN